MKPAVAIVGQPQDAVFDIEHHTAGNIADRKQHSLVGSTVQQRATILKLRLAINGAITRQCTVCAFGRNRLRLLAGGRRCGGDSRNFCAGVRLSSG